MVQVLIAVAGSPQLLHTQLGAIAAFFPADTRVLVVDDSRRRRHYSNNAQTGVTSALKSVALESGVDYVRIPQYLHLARRRLFANSHKRMSTGPSLRTADSVQFGLSRLGHDVEQLVILDSDMVPIKPFDPDAYFARSPVWYLPQTRAAAGRELVYPWPGIFFLDTAKEGSGPPMNWDCDVVDGVALDTGGSMRPWLQEHAGGSKMITGLHSGRWNWRQDTELDVFDASLHAFLDFDAQHNGGIQFAEIFEGTFLHLRAGSNWDPQMRGAFAERLRLFTSGINALVSR